MKDELMDKEIVDQLFWDVRVNAADVAVTVEDGCVTLSGKVPSVHTKYVAAEDAYSVNGVKSVKNFLTVEYPKIPTDKDMKEGVEDTLGWDFDLDARKITVSVHNGKVKLLGTVDEYWKKLLAEDDAFRINGVTDIRNELAIVSTGKWSDEMIAKDIEEALRRNASVEVNDINVKVAKGNVTLSGMVPNWFARTAANSSALYSTGVKSVDNIITIM